MLGIKHLRLKLAGFCRAGHPEVIELFAAVR